VYPIPRKPRRKTLSDVKISIQKNGPLKVEGNVPLFDADGNPVDPPRTDRYFLCRCGGSTKKPFCDGTHSRIGFVGAEAAVEAADEE
jgi:CDGSH-type Zn-finger protein